MQTWFVDIELRWASVSWVCFNHLDGASETDRSWCISTQAALPCRWDDSKIDVLQGLPTSPVGIRPSHHRGSWLANTSFSGGHPFLDSVSIFYFHLPYKSLVFKSLLWVCFWGKLNRRPGYVRNLPYVRLVWGFRGGNRHHIPRAAHSRHSANRTSLPWASLPAQFYLFPVPSCPPSPAKPSWAACVMLSYFPSSCGVITDSNYNSSLWFG